MQSLFWCSVFLVVYIYILYPVLVFLLARVRKLEPNRFNDEDWTPSISIIVPAHNEEQVIREKIENHLALDYPRGMYEVLVVSDGSTDATNKIVETMADKFENVRLICIEDRAGKTNAINKVIPSVTSEIVVFSDANVLLDSNALRNIATNFVDKHVGAVAGQLLYINEEAGGVAQGNGLYWRYEEFIKNCESLSGSMMGADGSIFAIRKCLYSQLPIHVLDDFCTSMGVVVANYRLVFDQRIKAFEKGAEHSSEEFHRKVRISNRSFNSYKYMRGQFLKKLTLINLWKLYSHKVLRWYAAYFMALAFISNLALAYSNQSLLYSAMASLQVIFYILAAVGFFDVFKGKGGIYRCISTIHYFVLANLASGVGVVRSMFGIKTTIWKKAESSR